MPSYCFNFTTTSSLLGATPLYNGFNSPLPAAIPAAIVPVPILSFVRLPLSSAIALFISSLVNSLPKIAPFGGGLVVPS